jgi:hypothetical protein
MAADIGNKQAQLRNAQGEKQGESNPSRFRHGNGQFQLNASDLRKRRSSLYLSKGRSRRVEPGGETLRPVGGAVRRSATRPSGSPPLEIRALRGAAPRGGPIYRERAAPVGAATDNEGGLATSSPVAKGVVPRLRQSPRCGLIGRGRARASAPETTPARPGSCPKRKPGPTGGVILHPPPAGGGCDQAQPRRSTDRPGIGI